MRDRTTWSGRKRCWPPAPHTALEGDTVRLTPTVDADLPELWAAMDDEQVWRHLPSPRPGDVQAMRAHHEALQERGFFPWTLRLVSPVAGLSPPAVVGWSCYLDVSQRDARCEIGGTSYAVPVLGHEGQPRGQAASADVRLRGARDGSGPAQDGCPQRPFPARDRRYRRDVRGPAPPLNRRADGTMRNSVLPSQPRVAARAGTLDPTPQPERLARSAVSHVTAARSNTTRAGKP